MSSQLQVSGEAKIRDIQGPVVANSGVITALDGAASQYVRGDGTLADFPTSSGGGSSVSYYLNSSVSQGTIGGVAYRELNKEPIIGAGTDIAISANGYVASYLTDANDPDVLSIPGGNFNCEFYFSVSNDTGNPFFYAELYKYDGTTFTLLGSSVGVPEYINQGTIIAPYYFAIPVPTSALALTDRLAIRIYVNVDGRTVTLHTENSHLCQVVTTLSKGMVSLNNLTDQSQYLTTGTSGTNFAIVSSGDTHTFNLPIASAANTGKLSSTDWSTFNAKQATISLTTTGTSGAATLVGATLNIPQYQGVLTNPVTGTGTTNTLPKFTGASTIGNSNITDDGTLITFAYNALFGSNVSQATSTPLNVSFGGTFGTNSPGSHFNLKWDLFNNVSTNNRYGIGFSAGLMEYQAGINGQHAFFVARSGDMSTQAFRIFATSNVLIQNGGTFTDSGFRLDVNGTARVSGQLTANSFVPTSSTIPTNGMYLSGTNTLGFATNGTLDMVLNEVGSLGVGTSSLTGYSLRINRNPTGATTTYGVAFEGTIQSDVTTGFVGYRTNIATLATTFTTGFLVHYSANQATFGAGSTISNQYGFIVESNVIGATNNFGFYGNIPAAANRWNLYMNGTANNYMAGSLGIGSTALTNRSLYISKNITGGTDSVGISQDGIIQSDATSSARYNDTFARVQNTAFTLGNLFHYRAGSNTFGSATVTNQYGFYVDATAIGATNNYGFFGNIPSGTNRWNLYMAGTAANYMAGNTGVGTTTLGSYIFNVGGSVATLVNFNSTNASGFYTTYSTSGTERAYIGLGANTISGLAISDFGIVGSSNIVIASGSGGTETMRIDSTKRIGIGTGASINASAKVQIDSTTQGFLPPRVTQAQRTAIATPATGLMVYQTDGTEGVYVYSGGAWKSLTMT